MGIEPFVFTGAERIIFGAGAEQQAAAELAQLGAKRVLLVAQPRHREGADRVAAALGDRAAGVFTDFSVQVPSEVADAARDMASRTGADWVLAHGGGTAIGVAKAVALTAPVSVAAIPTTYAGSERTNIWGITRDGMKTTGRDDRVKPKLVIYDPALTTSLGVDMSLQSLLNAMAHSVEALYAEDADEQTRDTAERSLAPLLDAMRAIAADPGGLSGRSDAQYGAYLAATALGQSSMGLHHKICHVLGGSFGVAHASAHAVILPHVVAFNVQGAALGRMQRALRHDDPARLLWDVSKSLGVPTRLGQPSFQPQDVPAAAAAVLEKRYANPRAFTQEDVERLLGDAVHGRRPSRHARRLQLATPTSPDRLDAATSGAQLDQARVAVLAVHGRGGNAEAFLDPVEAALSRRGDVAVLAPQAPEGSWYPGRFDVPPAENQPHLDAALETLDAAWARVTADVPADRVVLVGFSQGACLALSWLAARGHRPGHTVIWSGAHNPVGKPLSSIAELAVTLSVSEGDPWIPHETFLSTVAELRAGGARVQARVRPGDAHHIDRLDQAALHNAVETLMNDEPLTTQTGFGNAFQTEAVPGALPRDQNAPRQVAHGLHAEQINGTGFTVHRAQNRRTWMYRLRPQVLDRGFEPYAHPRFTGHFETGTSSPQIRRYRPLALPSAATDFLAGLTTFAGAGDPSLKRGMAIHLYAANTDMDDVFANIDGDLMIVPEHGRIRLVTELGRLDVAPTEIAVIPRGIRFKVLLREEAARGFVAEIFDAHFQLPERGLVGSNGLADERHFEVPVAWFEDRQEATRIVVKQAGDLHQVSSPFSPFDVVAWHGSYTPYKYDLTKFNSMGNVSWDHPDPSILTVLTSPADTHGRNTIDVAVFQRRWDVSEGTFRPPYFHRNSAIEFNAIVASDATGGPWQSGAFTYTPYLTPHGVSSGTVEHTLAMTDAEADRPQLLSENSMWVQFESTFLLRVMPWMLDHDAADTDYLHAFSGYPAGDVGASKP